MSNRVVLRSDKHNKKDAAWELGLSVVHRLLPTCKSATVFPANTSENHSVSFLSFQNVFFFLSKHSYTSARADFDSESLLV